jgi:hypothetical protein
MIYCDQWPEREWLEIFITCRLAGFDEFAGAFIDHHMNH